MLPPETPGPRDLLGTDLAGLERLVERLGEKPFRARQLYHWIYARRAASFEAMTDLSRPLRERLAGEHCLGRPRIETVQESSDGTRKYLLAPASGGRVESVCMPETDRLTFCISPQIGCALDCRFCLTAQLGLVRHLTAGEIVGQVMALLDDNEDRAAGRPVNIVMMGMGEPLLNYDAVMKAVRLFADEDGLTIAPRRVTLSTAGIVPRIYDLAKEEVRPRLAISLTAANDKLRDRLFPINRKYPLGELIEACRRYPLAERERLTFEYVMLDGVNDTDRDARELAKLLCGIRAKVNLIPHNPAPELPYTSSPMERIQAFQKILTDSGLPSFIRLPRGQDISAACGQLAARHRASE